MGNETKKEKDSSLPLISISDNKLILDTIKNDNDIYFITKEKNGETITQKKFKHKGLNYTPIDINSNFIETNSILFPSKLEDYGTLSDLQKSIRDYIYKYIDIPASYTIIVVQYVLLSYVYNNFKEIPYLRVIGDYGSGKSRLLKAIGSICYVPMLTNGGTSLSAIFRMIDSFKGTLILDEADFGSSDTQSEMIKLLNNGYQEGVPIMRADGEKFEVNCYNVFGPKIIGGRMEFRDKATESRCLSTVMKRTKRKDLPHSLGKQFDIDSLTLRNKLMKYRYDAYFNTELIQLNIDGIEPRLNQIINPILSLAKGNALREEIIKSIKVKQVEIKEERKNSLLGDVLHVIKLHAKDNSEIYYSSILDTLDTLDLKGRLNPRKLGSLLKQNLVKGTRKSDGTVIDLYKNKSELERLYKEYSVE